MTFFPVPQEFYRDPKYLGWSPAAYALWMLAGSWSCDTPSDGLVPATALALFPPVIAEAADELVERGIWRRARGGGYQFIEWPRECTRAHIEGKKQAWRERQAKHRSSKGVSSRVTHAGVTEGVTGESHVFSNTEIHKEKTSSSLGGASRKRAATRLPEDWVPTDTHRDYAQQHGLDLSREVFKFRHHAEANDRTQASWNAAFTNWLANASEWTKPKPKAAEAEWRRWAEQ